MKNFLINCVISDIETETLCDFNTLYKDDSLKDSYAIIPTSIYNNLSKSRPCYQLTLW